MSVYFANVTKQNSQIKDINMLGCKYSIVYWLKEARLNISTVCNFQ